MVLRHRGPRLPLIALAYVGFVAGLIAGFNGYALAAGALLLAVVAMAVLRRRPANIALAIIAFAGIVSALASAVPSRRITREERQQRLSAATETHAGRARQRAAVAIDSVFRGDAAIARALLIADQHEIPPDMRDRYARAGIVHMLSISGLHVAIIASAIALLLSALRVAPVPASIAQIAIVGTYVLVIGAPAPAVRSAVMISVALLARALQRHTSQWAALALGAFVPLSTPRTVLNLGYQLSVVGMAGLIASRSLSRRIIEPRLDGWRRYIAAEMLASVIATIVSAPLVAWHFGRVSLIAPLSNLVAGPLLTLSQPMLFLALLCSPALSAARFIADAAHPLLQLFDRIAAVSADVPGASLALVPDFPTAIAGALAVAGVVLACVSRYPVRPLLLAGAAVASMPLLPYFPARHSGAVELHVLDVGQGDAVLLRSDRGNWVLFDAGPAWRSGDAGRSTVLPYLMRRGGELRAFVLSHPHSDHAGGAATVLSALKPPTFIDAAYPEGNTTYADLLDVARATGIAWERVSPGDSLNVDGVTVYFLAPDPTWTASLTDPNEASTIALVKYRSARFLLAGDAEQEEERWLLENVGGALKADVLKVAHHGSSTSSGDAFLAAVQPRLAVISVGADNRYGHPSGDVLAALTRAGAETARTDQLGTIVVKTNGVDLVMEADGRKWDLSRN